MKTLNDIHHMRFMGLMILTLILVFTNNMYGGNNILYHTGHSSYRFSADLKAYLNTKGFTITENSGTLTASLLSGYHIVICSSSFSAYSTDEATAVKNFYDAGFGVFVVGGSGDNCHTQMNPVLSNFNITFGSHEYAGDNTVTSFDGSKSINTSPNTLSSLHIDGINAITYTNPSAQVCATFSSKNVLLILPRDPGLGALVVWCDHSTWEDGAGWDDDQNTRNFLENVFKYLDDNSLAVSMSNFYATLSNNKSVTIVWVTESEVDCFGFNIWRSKLSENNFIKINNEIIPGQGNSSISHDYQYEDFEVESNTLYSYKIEEVSGDGVSTFYGPIQIETVFNIPSEFILFNNYPNPFNPKTTIKYQLPNDSHVKLYIYNQKGELVRKLKNSYLKAGYHENIWYGLNDSNVSLPSGIYFIKIITDSYQGSQKAILLK